jgi:hypothetical protein
MTLALFFTLYCFEAGLFFLIAPWTRFWTVNPLITYAELYGIYLTSPWARGLFSGFGLIHLLVGARELMLILGRRRRQVEP